MKSISPKIQSSAQVSTYRVQGMDCADEVAAVKDTLDIPGIYQVDADLIKESISIAHDGALNSRQLIQLIEKSGLRVVDTKPKDFFHNNSKRIITVATSAAILGAGLVVEYLENSKFIPTLLFLATIILSGTIIFPKAIRSLKTFRLDMNVLMTIAVIGAIIIKEYSEAASVVFLFSLAELLEALSVTRARKAIQEVLKMVPKAATIITAEGVTEQRPVEELKSGDLLLVRPHDNIATDGIILEGETFVNQSSLTGESKAVEKRKGDAVFGGTINESGVITVKVEKGFRDSKLSKVISLIEAAQSEKAPAQRFVDKFASIYTPSVLVLSIFIATLPPLLSSADWNEWIYKALVFLVIGCPCALVIATPVSVVSGLTSLAKKGILVKGGVHLETLGKLKVLAVDKTGTITEGQPSVVEVRTFTNVSNDEAIKLASSLESLSTHPLATAILAYAKEKNISSLPPRNYKVLVGKGAEGVIDGHPYFVGNHKLAHELGVCTPEIENYLDEVESNSMSLVVLGHRPHEGCPGEIIAVFALSDQIRKGIKKAIESLHHIGVSQVIMLSGDNQKTVSSVSSAAGIDTAKGGLLPEDKVEEIKYLVQKYKYVGMVGDGVNDAPALASASLGIAMGVVGSDTAIETADVALMKDDIAMIPIAIQQGRKVLSVIRFNIAFAISIKIIFFILAFIGFANLWTAVAADMGASLLVTFNALRLLRST